MKRTHLSVIGILLLTLSTTQAALVGPGDYTGTITYSDGDGGITGTAGDWLNDDTSISWNIIDNGGSWTYQYDVNVGDDPEISHFILQVSDNFEIEDLIDGPEGGPQEDDPRIYGTGPSNPGIPGDIFGIKWEDEIDTTHWEFEITTTKAPTWGDFYAKGSSDLAIWNVGFTNPDNDNLDTTTNGEYNHIVVPDTVTTPSIPAPAAVLLGALGTCTATWLRRRRIM